MSSAEDGFRRVTIGDPDLLATMARLESCPLDVPRLDAYTEALVQVGVLIAMDAPQSSFEAAVQAAERAGARLEQLLAVLICVTGAVGSPRIVSAAPKIAFAAGYDVEAALERVDPVVGPLPVPPIVRSRAALQPGIAAVAGATRPAALAGLSETG